MKNFDAASSISANYWRIDAHKKNSHGFASTSEGVGLVLALPDEQSHLARAAATSRGLLDMPGWAPSQQDAPRSATDGRAGAPHGPGHQGGQPSCRSGPAGPPDQHTATSRLARARWPSLPTSCLPSRTARTTIPARAAAPVERRGSTYMTVHTDNAGSGRRPLGHPRTVRRLRPLRRSA
jgi:hypothetical protein